MPSPGPPTVLLRDEHIARLHEEIERLNIVNKTLISTNQRRLEVIQSQRTISVDLHGEVSRQKNSLEELQGWYCAAIERNKAQDKELRGHKAENEHLQRLIDQLQPQINTLEGYDLELKTYGQALRVVYHLIRNAGIDTSLDEILRRCRERVRITDARQGISHPQADHQNVPSGLSNDLLRVVSDLVDDEASEAASEEEASETNSLNDFVDYGESTVPTRHSRKKSTLPSLKRKRILRVKIEDGEDQPHTPSRAPSLEVDVGPLTPPSSRRKLPRRVRKGDDEHGFYNLDRLSSHGQDAGLSP